MIVYDAQFVLPVAAAPVRDGALAVHEDRIVAVGPADEVRGIAERTAGSIERRSLGQAAILPGLVNTHTHVELSWARDRFSATDDWVEWVRALLAARAEIAPNVAREATQQGLCDMTARGTVAVGDIANDTWAAPLVAAAGLHGVAFVETYGLGNAAAGASMTAIDESCRALQADSAIARAAGRLTVAPTPHAPHTTSDALLLRLARRAAAAGDPLSIHVAESAAETAWLRDGSGPLAPFFRERGFGDAGWMPPGLSPVQHLHRLGVLGPTTLAVHCVQLDTNDRALLQSSGATVVTCPRSNRHLGVGTAPVPELLGQGIPVALGTDSLASCPDLDLFAEMAALRREHPGLAPATILRMATLTGARALGIAGRLGSLEPGKLAAAIVVPLPTDCDDPADFLCTVPPNVYPLRTAPLDEVR